MPGFGALRGAESGSSPYQLIEQPCHTLGGPLTKPLSEPLAL